MLKYCNIFNNIAFFNITCYIINVTKDKYTTFVEIENIYKLETILTILTILKILTIILFVSVNIIA